MFDNFFVQAQTIDDPLSLSTNGGIADLAGRFLAPVYPIAGIIFLGLLIYGGYSYMTSGGDQQKVKQAQSILTAAVIGLVIILAAFLITEWLGKILGTNIL